MLTKVLYVPLSVDSMLTKVFMMLSAAEDNAKYNLVSNFLSEDRVDNLSPNQRHNAWKKVLINKFPKYHFVDPTILFRRF